MTSKFENTNSAVEVQGRLGVTPDGMKALEVRQDRSRRLTAAGCAMLDNPEHPPGTLIFVAARRLMRPLSRLQRNSLQALTVAGLIAMASCQVPRNAPIEGAETAALELATEAVPPRAAILTAPR